jgi:hemoglobin-like flavoprotein
MLSYIISKFESMEDIIGEVKELAERHTKYGVKDEHYNAVGSALMWTLEQGMGEFWTDELNNAWIDFCETLSTEMIAAQREHGSIVNKSFVTPPQTCPFKPGNL